MEELGFSCRIEIDLHPYMLTAPPKRDKYFYDDL